MSDHISPDHYSDLAIEPIEYILENKMGFCAGAIIKYVSRAGRKIYPGKDRDQSEVADLDKVIRFAEMRINYLNGLDPLTGDSDNEAHGLEDEGFIRVDASTPYDPVSARDKFSHFGGYVK